MNFLFTLSLLSISLAAPISSLDSNYSSNISMLYTTLPLSLSQFNTTPSDQLSSEELHDRLLANIDRAANKFKVDGGLSKRAFNSVYLGDSQGDNSYFTTVMIGSPPVAFELVIDTGSADMIVQTVPCAEGSCAPDTPLYRPSDSSSSIDLEKKFVISYQVGGATGGVISDVLSLGGFTGRQQFGAVTASSSSIGPGGVTGVLGLGFKPLSSIGQTPFLEAVYQAGKLTVPIFGVALARQAASAYATITPGGSFNLGWVDNALFKGDLSFNDVHSPYYWQISLDKMIVSGQVLASATTKYCTIDTGTTNIYIPLAIANQLYNTIPGSSALGNGLYVYPCSATVNAAFVFGGITYYMPDSDFNIGYYTQHLCYGAVSSIGQTNNKDTYIIGIAFLKNVYAAFRFSPLSVGFAPLANPTALKSGVIPTGNALTIAQAGNIAYPKASVPVIPIAITTVAAAAPSGIPSISITFNTTPTSLSIGNLAASLQNSITNLIIEIARNIQNTELLITCQGRLNKTVAAWVCEN